MHHLYCVSSETLLIAVSFVSRLIKVIASQGGRGRCSRYSTYQTGPIYTHTSVAVKIIHPAVGKSTLFYEKVMEHRWYSKYFMKANKACKSDFTSGTVGFLLLTAPKGLQNVIMLGQGLV